MKRLMILLFALFLIVPAIHAQEWDRQEPIAVGETVEGDFSEDVIYVTELEAGETIFLEVESEQPARAYIDPGFATTTAEGTEFNVPATGRYEIRVGILDEDAPDEGAYSLTVIGVEQVETQIGETVTIPAGAESPYYLIFPAAVGEHVRVTADSEDVGIRVENTAGDTVVYNGNTTLNREFYFGNDVTLPPFVDGIHRAVISAGEEVETFPAAVNVTIEGLETINETIDIGETIEMTSDLVNTFTLDLEAGQAVEVSMTNEFRGWLHIITPDRGQIYRSGHMASGSNAASTTYMAAEDESLLLRVSGASAFPAEGAFTLRVDELPVQSLTSDPLTLTGGDSEGFISAEVEAGQSYRLVITADEEIGLTLSNAQSNSPAVLPNVRMSRLFETVRIWEANTTGTAFISVSYTPDDVSVRLSLEAVD